MSTVQQAILEVRRKLRQRLLELGAAYDYGDITDLEYDDAADFAEFFAAIDIGRLEALRCAPVPRTWRPLHTAQQGA